jgi:hypothetical protein
MRDVVRNPRCDYMPSIAEITICMSDLLKKAKKAFATSMVAIMAVVSMGAASLVAPLAARAAVAPGSLVKGSLSAVYFVGTDNKRYVFPNEKTYKTWYSDFSTVQTITDAELASLPIGGNVTYRPGVKMIKIQSDPKVYAVDAHGTLRWVTSESIAIALYGVNWNKMIDDVSDAFFVNYTIGADITSASQFNPAAVTAAAVNINVDKGLSGTIGGNLSAALSSGSPASSVIPKSATGVEFTRFTVRNNGSTAATLDTVIAHRIGAGQTTDFANVYLYEGNRRVTTGRTVNSSTNDVTFSGMSLSLAGGETKTLSVVADIANTATAGASNVHAFEITKALSGSVIASGLPVVGNTMSLSSATAGSITISKSGSITNPKVGQPNVQIGEFQLAAGATEDLEVRRISLFQTGSISRSNLTNFKLMQGGNTVATASSIDEKDHITFDVTSMLMEKGASRTFQVYADIGGGARSGDTIKLFIEESTDLLAIGRTFGFGASVVKTNYDGDTCVSTADSTGCSFVTIEGGQVTLSFNGPTRKDIPVNGRDIEVYNFTIAAQSNIEIRNLRFAITAGNVAGAADGLVDSSGATNVANYTDIKVVDATTGQTVAGPLDVSTTPGDTTQNLVYTDVITMNAGQTKTFKVTLDVANNVAAAFANDTIRVDHSAFASNDIRNLDNSTFVASTEIVPSGAINGNAHNIQASSLTISLATTPVAQTFIQGAQGIELAGFNLKAGDANDVKLTSLSLQGLVDTFTNNSVAGNADFQLGRDDDADADAGGAHVAESKALTDILLSAKLMNGAAQIGDSKSPTASTAVGNGGLLQFTNLNLTIPKGQTITVKLVGTVASSISLLNDKIAFQITDAAAATVQDPDGNSVTASAAAFPVNGTPTTAMTISGNGTITLVKAADDIESERNIVVGGTTNAVLGKFRWTAANEELDVTKLRVTVAAAAGTALNSISLYDGSTLVAGPVAVSGTVADFSSFHFIVPKDSSKTMTVKGNLNSVSPSGATSGADVKVTIDTNANFEVKGTSAGSNTSITTALTPGTVGGNTKIIRRTKPTVTVVALPSSTLTNGTQVVSRFTISADAAEQVTVKKIDLNIALNGTGVIVSIPAADSSIREVGQSSNIGGASTVVGSAEATTLFCSTADQDAGAADAADTACRFRTVFTNEQAIAAGTSKTYEVRLTLAGIDTAGESISTSLLGDTAQVTGELEAGATATQTNIDDLDGTNAATAEYSFIWSDNSAIPHGETAGGTADGADATAGASDDWTNGLDVKVLPSDTQTMTRS